MKTRTKAVTTGGVLAGVGGALLLYYGDVPPEELVEACKVLKVEAVKFNDGAWGCDSEPVLRRVR